MNHVHPDMIEATRLTRTGRLAEAMALLGRLRGGAPAGGSPDVIDGRAETVEVSQPRGRLPEALRGLIDRFGSAGPGLGGLAVPSPAPVSEPLPDGARFVSGSYTGQAGTRAYKLYVPSGYRGRPVPLLVMLHGCTQSPDDFAAGTRMNALAEESTFLVVYPAQDAAANPQRCWNWFSPEDQRRDRGEPSLIAGITRQVMRDHAVDPARVYVAGMSAGGAEAVVMAATYPDLYAAVGVHSGLPYGAASDMPSAFTAMRQGGAGQASPKHLVPTIVFHGDQDGTVNPVNGDRVIEQARAAAASLQATAAVQRGRAPGGLAYTRSVHADMAGKPVHEQWVVQGAGHAWSGGNAAGSYTDPRGPDASREMLRFFLEHPRAG